MHSLTVCCAVQSRAESKTPSGSERHVGNRGCDEKHSLAPPFTACTPYFKTVFSIYSCKKAKSTQQGCTASLEEEPMLRENVGFFLMGHWRCLHIFFPHISSAGSWGGQPCVRTPLSSTSKIIRLNCIKLSLEQKR